MKFKILLDNIETNATKVASNIVKKRNPKPINKGLKKGKDIIDLMGKNENDKSRKKYHGVFNGGLKWKTKRKNL